jgi:DNA-binding IclR family transcriptional regulator
VLECLGQQAEPIPYATIEEETELPGTTVRRVAEDLVALKLATRAKDSGNWRIQEGRASRDYRCSERSPETSEGAR